MCPVNFISIAKKGCAHWNEWVGKNPEVEVDFSNTDFTDPALGLTSLEGFSFQRANFRGAEFGDNFSFAFCKFGAFPDFSKSKFGAWANFEYSEFGTHARFSNTTFGPSANFSFSSATGEIYFSNASFGECARFENVRYRKAYFQNSVFESHVSFDNANLKDSPIFMYAEFGNSASFRDVHFGSNTNFSQCTFGSMADFCKAKFAFGASFKHTVFGSMAKFSYVAFDGSVGFDHAKFGSQVEFDYSKFSGFSSFKECTLDHPILFQHVLFEHNVDFFETKFQGQALFYQVNFSKLAQFTNCEFGKNSYFSGKYGDGVVFNGSTFTGIPYIGLLSEDDKVLFQLTGTKFHNSEGNNGVVNRLQKLKSIADSTNSLSESRDLFILLRTAEIRVLGKVCNNSNMCEWILSKSRYILKKSLWFFYGLFGDYGRSAARPVIWLLLLNIGFYTLYRFLYEEPLFYLRKIAIRDYTLANSLPFGRLLNPAFDGAIQILFHTQRIGTNHLGEQIVSNHTLIPLSFQLLGIIHNAVSAVLIFLALLAVRNFFKIG